MITLLQRSDLCRSPPLRQEFPAREQFLLVQFGPGLHEPLRPLGNRPGKQLNWSDREYGRILLIIGVKVRYMVPL